MLADVVVEKRTIPVTGGSFDVHGVTFNDVARLVAEGHMAELAAAIKVLQPLAEEGQIDVQGAIGGLVIQLPNLCAKLIAFAAHEPEQVDKVRGLPVSVQLEALLGIGELTFVGEHATKKFVSGLTTLLGSVTSLVTTATSQIASIGGMG